MEYRRLGTSGLKVSVIGLGSWLTYGSTTESETGRSCIRRAYELGVNHFDCANKYGDKPHAAEEFLGEALRPFPRSSYVLTTKAYYPVGPGPNDRGLSRKHLFEQVHLSLRHFGTDYIDIMYCHRFDAETPLEETLRALHDLVAQGKVLYIGISEWPSSAIAEAVGLTRLLGFHPITASQPVYNMLARRIEAEEMPTANRAGIGIVAFSALGQGLLTGKYRPGHIPAGSRADQDEEGALLRKRYLTPEHLQIVERLRPIAADLSVSMSQLALAWVLRRREVSSALTGASRPEQVDENVRAADVKLPKDVLTAIDQALTGQ